MSSCALIIGLSCMETGVVIMDKSWIMDMEEDAIDMSAEAWCEKYGESLIEVYHEARRKYADLVEDDNE